MKASDLKTKTMDELTKELIDLKKKQFNLRFQLSQGQLENTVQIRTVRRNVARVKTFINMKNKEGQEPAKKAPAKSDKKKSGSKAA